MPGFLEGVLYAPNTLGYRNAGRLRRRIMGGYREHTRSPFESTVSRSRSIGQLPHLLVGFIHVCGYRYDQEYDEIRNSWTCPNKYYCGIRILCGRDVVTVILILKMES